MKRILAPLVFVAAMMLAAVCGPAGGPAIEGASATEYGSIVA